MRASSIVSILAFWATEVACFPQLFISGQKPLQQSRARSSESWNPQYAVREQSSELCDAGSRQWTGTVNVTDNKSMFFWYFESRHNPETAPMVLWFSGGPGATGEMGLFKGVGPCAVNKNGNSTRRLEYSWTDYANVIFIDQPIGVGFSELYDPEALATDLHAGAQDVYSFLDVFVRSIFPETAKRTWHITGESMGGHYVLGYTKYIVTQERERARQGLALGLDFRSAIIVSGYVDASQQTVGAWDFLCDDWRRDGRKAPLMNATACSKMANGIPTCEKQSVLCRETYDKDVCTWAADSCGGTVGVWAMSNVRPGGWSPYDTRLTCDQPPLCTNFDNDETRKFLNQPWVQQKLGFSPFNFSLIDFDVNMRWQQAKNVFIPATRELTWLLDDTDFRVLFINGNNDLVVCTPGQMRLLDNQPWKGQASFRSLGYREWFYEDGELSDGNDSHGKVGGTWKGYDKLKFFSIDEAGHFVGMDQPEAIGAIVRSWLRSEDEKSSL